MATNIFFEDLTVHGELADIAYCVEIWDVTAVL
jgi:hypothetical protein